MSDSDDADGSPPGDGEVFPERDGDDVDMTGPPPADGQAFASAIMGDATGDLARTGIPHGDYTVWYEAENARNHTPDVSYAPIAADTIMHDDVMMAFVDSHNGESVIVNQDKFIIAKPAATAEGDDE